MYSKYLSTTALEFFMIKAISKKNITWLYMTHHDGTITVCVQVIQMLVEGWTFGGSQKKMTLHISQCGSKV